MNTIFYKLVLLLCFLNISYSQKGPFNGEGLYKLLTSQNINEKIEGKYYVLGFWQGFLKAERLGLKNESLRSNFNYVESENFYSENILVPKHIKSKQILEIVLKYLEKNPNLRMKDSPTLIFEAIYKRFN
tara:strand:+ start:500 stop:889 length:390 start_codon:yes stop_codon:yes gene_type:complete